MRLLWLVLSVLWGLNFVEGSSRQDCEDDSISDAAISQAITVVHTRVTQSGVSDAEQREGSISPATQPEVRDLEDFFSPLIPQNRTFPTLEDLDFASFFTGMSLEDKITTMLKWHSAQSNSQTRFNPDEFTILEITNFYEASLLLTHSYISRILKTYSIIIPDDYLAMSYQEVFTTWYGVNAALLQKNLP